MPIGLPYNRIIYIVDDDSTVRESLGFLLGTMSIECRLFDGGASFLAEAPGLPNGCVLLDLMMPDVDGLQVTRSLLDGGRKMPVILMTAAGSDSTIRLAAEIGPFLLLEKPFSEDALINALELSFEMLTEGATVSRATRARQVLAGLNPREVLVLRGLMGGMDTDEIAARLNMSQLGVRRTGAKLKARLGAEDNLQAIEIGTAGGLPPLERSPEHFGHG